MLLYHKKSESQAKIIGIGTFSQAGKGMAAMPCSPGLYLHKSIAINDPNRR
jgi:hypothetical protein